jgi:hypothetical protein
MKVNIGKFPKNGYQKISVEIERHDTWNMAYTLAYIIYPMLLKLKEEKQGIPNEFANAGGEKYLDQMSFDFYEESHDWAFEEKCKQWDIVLDKMIWSFEQLLDDDWESKYHHGKHETEWIQCDDQTLNPGGHWYDHDGHLLHISRMQEGFELFGKYFQNLWD